MGTFQKSNDIENVLKATDIVSLIGRYIHLKKTGLSYKALCPFHKEKTPSFVVNSQKQIYYCFGCGRGGDAINFLTLYEKISFKEALETLAQENGIQLSNYKPIDREKQKKELDEKNLIYKINSEALDFYVKTLSNMEVSSSALAYLRGRGISKEIQSRFMLGYAPGGWTASLNHLIKKGYPEAEIIKAGLAVKSEKSARCYDRFRERIIFPIHDVKGKIIGFGARVIPPVDDSLPKYINSPETSVFNKRNNLFGLNSAIEHFKRSGYAIVSEGYLDVISAHQAGLCHAVAPLGTALTDSHIKLISRYTDCIVLVFDSDAAGIKAVHRVFEKLSGHKIKVKTVLLPQNYDLDSFIQEFGATSFLEKLKEAPSLIEFLLNYTASESNLSSIDGQVDCVTSAVSVLERIDDPLVLSRYITHFSELTKISQSAIQNAVEKKRGEKFRSGAGANVQRQTLKRSVSLVKGGAGNKAQIALVKMMVRKSAVMSNYLDGLEISDFDEGYLRDVFSVLKMEIQAGESSFAGKISSKFKSDDCINFITSVLIEEDELEYNTNYHIAQCVNAIHKERTRKRIRQIQERIRNSAREGSGLDHQLIREYTALEKALKCPVSQESTPVEKL